MNLTKMFFNKVSEFMVKLPKINNTEYNLDWLYGVIFVPFVGEIRK